MCWKHHAATDAHEIKQLIKPFKLSNKGDTQSATQLVAQLSLLSLVCNNVF